MGLMAVVVSPTRSLIGDTTPMSAFLVYVSEDLLSTISDCNAEEVSSTDFV